MLTKLKIGAAAPDFTLPHRTKKSWRLAEGIQSPNALLVVNICFA
jgi:peroxiredoxin